MNTNYTEWFKNNAIAFVMGGALAASITWGVQERIAKRESDAFIHEKAALQAEILVYQKQVDDLKKTNQYDAGLKLQKQQQKDGYVQGFNQEILEKEGEYRVCVSGGYAGGHDYTKDQDPACIKIAEEIKALQDNRTKVMLAE